MHLAEQNWEYYSSRWSVSCTRTFHFRSTDRHHLRSVVFLFSLNCVYRNNWPLNRPSTGSESKTHRNCIVKIRWATFGNSSPINFILVANRWSLIESLISDHLSWLTNQRQWMCGQSNGPWSWGECKTRVPPRDSCGWCPIKGGETEERPSKADFENKLQR